MQNFSRDTFITTTYTDLATAQRCEHSEVDLNGVGSDGMEACLSELTRNFTCLFLIFEGKAHAGSLHRQCAGSRPLCDSQVVRLWTWMLCNGEQQILHPPSRAVYYASFPSAIGKRCPRGFSLACA